MTPNRRRMIQGSVAALALSTPQALAADGGKPMKPLRILILGGTGFIGPHQVRYALARGHKLTLFNRGRRPKDWPAEVEELTGDRNAGDLKTLENGEWDVCIDNPTTLPFWVRDAGQVLKGRVGHYVFVSTLSVYADNATPGAAEDAPLAAYAGADAMAETAESLRDSRGALYGPLKAESERTARRIFGDGAVSIVRPGLICGPGDETDRFTYWPARLANDGGRWDPTVLAPGAGDDPVQIIDARDLAEWIVRVAEARAAGGFNATGRPIPMRTLLAEVSAGVGAKPPLAWAPTPFLRAEQVAPWSDMPVWIPAEGPTAGFHGRSIERALAAGLTFRPVGTTAADALAWLREQPAERREKLRAGLAPEREAALLGKLNAAGAS